jgi:ferredoxin-type protein NapH
MARKPRTGIHGTMKTIMKTRQKVRRGLLIASLVLFPVTFYWLSPAVPLQGAAEGVVAGSLVVFAALFVQSLLLGRLFCGWACPAGGLQEVTALVRGRPVRRRRVNGIKYLVWVPWLATVVFLFIRAGGVKRVDPLYLTWHGISVADWHAAVIALIVLLVLFLPAFIVGRRASCHTLCWMAPFMITGRWIRNQFAWASLRLATEKDRCTSCGACTKACPMSIDVTGYVQRGSLECSDCILCGSCVDACPRKAIAYTFSKGR